MSLILPQKHLEDLNLTLSNVIIKITEMTWSEADRQVRIRVDYYASPIAAASGRHKSLDHTWYRISNYDKGIPANAFQVAYGWLATLPEFDGAYSDEDIPPPDTEEDIEYVVMDDEGEADDGASE
jgi:hypothetical protein